MFHFMLGSDLMNMNSGFRDTTFTRNHKGLLALELDLSIEKLAYLLEMPISQRK